MFVTLSRKIPKIKHLDKFLENRVEKYTFLQNLNLEKTRSKVTGVLTWGYKKRIKDARKLANKLKKPLVHLEDGFLRSLKKGRECNSPLSLIIDDLGIYYDANTTSRLEYILQNFDQYLKDKNISKSNLLEKAKKAIKLKNKYKLTKFNHYTEEIAYEFPSNKRILLLIDQAENDASVEYGFANEQTFREMLNQALKLEDTHIVVKLTPANQIGYLEKLILKDKTLEKQITCFSKNTNPIDLLTKVDEVHTVSSQLGFEALLLGLPVKCFGVPFYSNWGLTEDVQIISRRNQNRNILELFAASYILYPRYINPFSGESTDIFYTLELLKKQVEINQKNSGEIYCFGFNLFTRQSWKRNRIKKLLTSTNNKIYFPSSVEQAKTMGINSKSKIYVWGSKDSKIEGLSQLSKELNLNIGRIEDGFIRSAGLGSGIKAISSIVDSAGIYFDPQTESDLENIFNNSEFNEELIESAKKIKNFLLKNNIDKYNIETSSKININFPTNKKIILVPGQISQDASIKRGCIEPINTNLNLLKKVKEENPDAYIIFKVHPDIIYSNGIKDNIPNEEFFKYCDHFEEESKAIELISYVDEVHTMTSQVGFEALIRDKKVVTYGFPFYMGWGLSEDKLKIAKRKRKLSVDELIAGTLILYPRYFDWNNEMFCLPCDALKKISEELQKTNKIIYERKLTSAHSIKRITKEIIDILNEQILSICR
ncbi:MAG: hypothetical protein QNJ31_06460 [Candidatus Caenarcaniphilales bacterium]|nr:hypothetical protein [Candidatus Caenarcaniphilales bacterium]